MFACCLLSMSVFISFAAPRLGASENAQDLRGVGIPFEKSFAQNFLRKTGTNYHPCTAQVRLG
jgi:hypothetical protein